MSVNAGIFRNLASMHRAGVAWPEALQTVADRRVSLAPAAAAVAEGHSITEALRPLVAPVDAALLRAGEASGALEQTFENLATRHEEQARARSQQRARLAYPVLIGHVGALLLAVPDFLKGDIGGGLLWSAAILAPVYLLLWWSRRSAGDGSNTPAWGPWLPAAEDADARVLDSLGACLSAGVPLPETLELALEAAPGSRAARDLVRAQGEVEQGRPLSGAWRDLPRAICEALSTSEHAGELAQAATRTANELHFSAQMRRERSAARLPVWMMLAVGLIVGMRLLRFYGDLYSNLPI